MIVITAPTSSIGKNVLHRLIASYPNVRVIARDAGRIEPADRARVSVVEGSHSDADVVARATEGAHAVFWLVPPNPKAPSVDEAYSGFTSPGLAAMRAQGVRRIVGISGLGRGTAQAGNAGMVTATLAMDDLIAESGIAYRAVTCPSFFDNLLRQVQPIREKGVFFSAVDPLRKVPGCATQDIAEISVRLLLNDEWAGVGHQAVLGPEDLSFEDMAAVMTAVFGKPVKCLRTDYDAYKQQFVRRGMSEAIAQGLTDMVRAKSEGLDNGEIRTSQNTTPTSFRQWCEEVLKPAVTG
jgi:uncharacterized protein YbjT (DUF2867 family)